MPVFLALLGAVMSGIFLWVIWGNGIQVINHWIDNYNARALEKKNVKAIADARERASRAPLRSIEDPREAAMVLLTKLAMLRGEITAEQNIALSRIANMRLGLEGKAEHHTTLAAFAARQTKSPEAVISDLSPLFHARLSPLEKEDLFAMLAEIAALHGGPTEAQVEMIERLRIRLGFRGAEGNARGA